MKIIHLSDLHIGKYIFERSLISDQEYILDQILNIIKKEKVQVVMISGDVYDKQIPPIAGVELLNKFLTNLIKENVKVLIIPGNHDSDSRLSFGNEIFLQNGLYIESAFNGTLRKVTIEDVNFYMLPFVKPLMVRKFYPECDSYQSALEHIINNTDINYNEKNVFMTHQFYTYNGKSPELSDEEINLGGIENVDIKLLESFNYVAMGHIHRPQKLYKDTFRYSGSILKYSFQENNYPISIPLIDTSDFSFELIPITPLRDMITLKGELEDVIKNKSDDYIRVILTNDEELIDPLSTLRKSFPNLLRLEFRNKRFEVNNDVSNINGVDKKSPLELFEEFYLLQNNMSLSSDAKVIFNECMEGTYEAD